MKGKLKHIGRKMIGKLILRGDIPKVPPGVWFSYFAHVHDAMLFWQSQGFPSEFPLDPCQWADGRLGRVVQQTINLEGE